MICKAQYNDLNLGYVLKNIYNRDVAEVLVRDIDKLAVLLDSATSYYSPTNADSIMHVLEVLSQYADGATTELIAVSSFDLFLKNPEGFLKCICKNTLYHLESMFLIEVCIDVNQKGHYKSKEEVQSLITKLKKQSDCNRKFYRRLSKKLDTVVCR